MLKIMEWILKGISSLLIIGWVALLIFGADFVTQQWVSGVVTGVTLLAGLLHKLNKENEEDDAKYPMPVEQTPVKQAPVEQADAEQTYASAQALEAHGDPLGRWWRR